MIDRRPYRGRSLGILAPLASTLLLASCAGDREGRPPDAPESVSPPSSPSSDQVCAVGDALACERAGEQRTQVRDYALATTYYQAACNAGRALSCNRLGFFFNTGLGMARSEPKAFEWDSRSCALGDPSGCASVAILLAIGSETLRDLPRALALAQTWCDRGGALACDAYGRMLWQSGDQKRAVELFEKACNAASRDREGHQGCIHLAEAYRDGKGVPQDVKKAMDLASKACDAGMPSACNLLGWIHWDGRDIPRDASIAVPLFRRACDEGDALACTNLGARYLHGEGVETDGKKAAELFKWSCERGLKKACENLESTPAASGSSSLASHGRNAAVDVAQGTATITLVTPGARVLIVNGSDQRELPATPMSVNFDMRKPGTWVIHATKAGYCEYVQAIDFSDGVAKKAFRVELLPGCGQ